MLVGIGDFWVKIEVWWKTLFFSEIGILWNELIIWIFVLEIYRYQNIDASIKYSRNIDTIYCIFDKDVSNEECS